MTFQALGQIFQTRFAMAAPAASTTAKIEQTQYNGWNVYRLTNGIVSLLIAPQLGGRAIQMQLGEHEYFFVNKDLAGKVLPPEQNNLKSGWANYAAIRFGRARRDGRMTTSGQASPITSLMAAPSRRRLWSKIPLRLL